MDSGVASSSLPRSQDASTTVASAFEGLPAVTISPTERKGKAPSHRSRLDPVVEGEPVDSLTATTSTNDSKATKVLSASSLGVQRSQYFEDKLQERNRRPGQQGEHTSIQAMLCCEVKTNVIIHDEFTFITELSGHLAARYGQPVATISVTVQHGICMLFGGSFDPSYTMTLTALPHQVQATTNKRNLLLLQRHMEQAISVPAIRGIVRFVSVPRECVGRGFKMAVDEAEDQAQNKTSSPMSERADTRKRTKIGSTSKLNLSIPESKNTSKDNSVSRSTSPSSNRQASGQGMDGKEATGRVRSKKSLMQLIFQRSGRLGEAQEDT